MPKELDQLVYLGIAVLLVGGRSDNRGRDIIPETVIMKSSKVQVWGLMYYVAGSPLQS